MKEAPIPIPFPDIIRDYCPTIGLSEIKARRFHIIDRRPWGCAEVKEEEFVCRVTEETLEV